MAHEIEEINLQTAEEITHDFVPQSFADYLGQTELKKKLSIYTQAARMRQEAMDHLLFFGPPGLGKTTLATIMAKELGVGIKICSGPMMERTGDLVAILSSLDKHDILFIDEIHRMPTNVEEVLYTAMEQYRVDVIIGQGAGAKSISLPISPFTLVGATTKSGMISAPLRSRFGIIERLDFYSDDELQQIIEQSARFLQLPISQSAAFNIGKRARGTPRIAKKLLRRVRDFAQVHQQEMVNDEAVAQALNFLGIDEDGLNENDNLLLRKIIERFNGGPVGVETLACLIGEEVETIESVYEPYLLRKGYLEKTARGRQIPPLIMPHLLRKYGGQQRIG